MIIIQSTVNLDCASLFMWNHSGTDEKKLMESVPSGKTLDAVQMRRQHLKHGSAATNIPKFSISMEDSGPHGKVP